MSKLWPKDFSKIREFIWCFLAGYSRQISDFPKIPLVTLVASPVERGRDTQHTHRRSRSSVSDLPQSKVVICHRNINIAFSEKLQLIHPYITYAENHNFILLSHLLHAVHCLNTLLCAGALSRYVLNNQWGVGTAHVWPILSQDQRALEDFTSNRLAQFWPVSWS